MDGYKLEYTTVYMRLSNQLEETRFRLRTSIAPKQAPYNCPDWADIVQDKVFQVTS